MRFKTIFCQQKKNTSWAQYGQAKMGLRNFHFHEDMREKKSYDKVKNKIN